VDRPPAQHQNHRLRHKGHGPEAGDARRHHRILAPFPRPATSYSAATSGKEKDDPYYGITRTGMKARYGIIAVDPKVIALRSECTSPATVRQSPATPAARSWAATSTWASTRILPALVSLGDVYLLTPGRQPTRFATCSPTGRRSARGHGRRPPPSRLARRARAPGQI